MPIVFSLIVISELTKILIKMIKKLIKPIPKPSYTNILSGLNVLCDLR